MVTVTKDTPVGYELDGVKKQMVIQLMASRSWGRSNPVHWDPPYAAERGLKAPIATGQMSAAYIAEMCVNFFGEHFFRSMRISGKYVKPVYAGETITTHGVIREKTPEGSGYRFKVEAWADNEDGEMKTVAWIEVLVE
mgnify:CR=1 FL=1